MTKENNQFLRLHVHSVHSTRDGLLPIETIVDEAIANNELPSLTDHGTVGGVIDFLAYSDKKNIVPAVGCEFYVNKNIKRLQELRQLISTEKDPTVKKALQKERDAKRKHDHLVIYAKNTFGFYNIIKLNNIAYITGFYNRPTIDYDELFNLKADENGDYGIIITSACMAGIIGKSILNNDIETAKSWAKAFKKKFKKDYYLEVQTNGMKEQKKINKGIIKIAEELKIKMVVGNDAHYLTKQWASAHQDLLLLQNKNTRDDIGKYDFRITWENNKGEEKSKKVKTGKEFRKGCLSEDVTVGMVFNKDTVVDIKKVPRAWESSTDETYYKSEADLRNDIKQHKELSGFIDDIVKSHYEIAKKIKKIKLDTKNKLPQIENAYETLVKNCKQALKTKKLIKKSYVDRLKLELKIIKRNNFANYFLILSDFIAEARNRNIAIGAGRGSAVSSLISYLLKITTVDPLDKRWKGNMNFSRFLNPERLESRMVTFINEKGKKKNFKYNDMVWFLRNGVKMVLPAYQLEDGDELI